MKSFPKVRFSMPNIPFKLPRRSGTPGGKSTGRGLRYPLALKLVTGFGLCVALIIVQAIVALVTTSIAQQRTDDIVRAIPSTRETRDSVLQIVTIESALRGYALAGDKTYLKKLDDARTKLEENSTALKVYSVNHPLFAKWMADASPKIDGIATATDTILSEIRSGKRDQAISQLHALSAFVDEFAGVGDYIDDG